MPKSVLATLPEAKRLSVHPLPEGTGKATTVFISRKGEQSVKVSALLEALLAARGSKR